MKKRLLITSIVMMLVVAVALSTATYAWFTSNVSVTANTITMTAGTSQSSALGIQWKAGTAGPGFNANYTTDIDSVSPALIAPAVGGFQPAAPLELTNAEPAFYTAFIDSQGAFQADGAATTVYRFANYENADETPQDETYSNVIHVANLAQSGDQTLYLTASITPVYTATQAEEVVVAGYTYYNSSKVALNPQPAVGAELDAAGYKAKDATSLVRIAVFEVSGNGYATYTYKGLLGKVAATNNTALGEIEASDSAVDLLTASTLTELNLGTITAQGDKAYAIYVWLDGAAFDEAQSTKQAEIALTFATSSVNS